MSWIVRDGQNIWIWKDPWLPKGTLRSYIEGPLLLHDKDRRVSSLQTNHSWTFNSLNFPLSPQLQNLIQDILVLHFARISDAFMWPYNDGTCLVKSASKFLFHQQQVPLNKPVWNWIWALQCPKKIQIFF